MQSARRAVYLSFAAQYGKQAIQLAVVVVLARFLTPREIGAFSVILVFVALAHVLRSFGVQSYLIKEKELTTEKLRAAIFVTFACAWVAGGVLFGIRYLIAGFYGEPGLADAMAVLSAVFFVLPFTSVKRALLNRELRLQPLMVAGLLNAFVNGVTAVTLALLGFGYMSLAWATLLGALSEIAIIALTRGVPMPKWPSLASVGDVARFGGLASMGSMLDMLRQGVPDMVIGRVISLDALGFFSRGMGLVRFANNLVLRGIQPVVLPILSGAYRQSPGRAATAYLQILSNTTAVVWPAFLVIAIAAEPAIYLMFGPQWGPSVPVAQALCVWAALATPQGFAAEALVGTGNIRAATLLRFVHFAIVVIAVGIGATQGLVSVAAAMSVGAAVHFVVIYALLKRAMPLNGMAAIRTMLRALPMCVFSACGPTFIVLFGGEYPAFMQVVAVFLSAAIGWLWALKLTGHELWFEAALLIEKLTVLSHLRRPNADVPK